MAGKYNLSELEYELMDYIWKYENGVYFKDLSEHFIVKLGKHWKRPSLRTFLLRLQEKGFIEIDQTTRRSYIYKATKTKEEHIQNWTKNLLEEAYDNSIKNFVCALNGGITLSKEDVSELRDMIDEWDTEQNEQQ